MTKLSNFRVDPKALREGEWQPLGEEFGTIEVLTRGLTDKYEDARSARQRLAAKAYGGDAEKLKVAVRKRINTECLVEFCLMDVRGVDDDDGSPLSIEKFGQMLVSGEYPDVLQACFQAAQRVGKQTAEDLEDAVGNSSPLSATDSSGDDTES